MKINDDSAISCEEELEKLRIPEVESQTVPVRAEQHKDAECQSDPGKSFSSKITLEPALAGAMFAITLSQTSIQNLYIRTACLELGFGEETCSSHRLREQFPDAELESQRLVSNIFILRGIVGALISSTVLLFVGPWSDYSGQRRPLIMLSLLGMCLMTSNLLIALSFPGYPVVWLLYAAQIPMSVGGNFGLLLAAGFSYIGDVCNATGRNVTFAMGRNRACIQCASVLGAILGPLIFRHFGFYAVFSISLSCQILSLAYVIMKVVDVKVNKDNTIRIFDIRLPCRALGCLFKKREGNKRRNILLMMAVAVGDRIVMSADVALLFFYLRNKFSWNDIMFGIYVSYKNILSFLGTVIILRLLKGCLKMSDEFIGTLSSLSLALGCVMMIFAKNNYLVFAVPAIALLSQGSQVVQRPITNKQILASEQGQIYSVVGGLEMLCQIVWSPIYSALYTKTVSVFPDAWLLLSLGLALMQASFFLLARNKE